MIQKIKDILAFVELIGEQLKQEYLRVLKEEGLIEEDIDELR